MKMTYIWGDDNSVGKKMYSKWNLFFGVHYLLRQMYILNIYRFIYYALLFLVVVAVLSINFLHSLHNIDQVQIGMNNFQQNFHFTMFTVS
jgi:hypothetical protein